MDKQKYQNDAIFVSSASVGRTVTCTGSAVDPGPHLFLDTNFTKLKKNNIFELRNMGWIRDPETYPGSGSMSQKSTGSGSLNLAETLLYLSADGDTDCWLLSKLVRSSCKLFPTSAPASEFVARKHKIT